MSRSRRRSRRRSLRHALLHGDRAIRAARAHCASRQLLCALAAALWLCVGCGAEGAAGDPSTVGEDSTANRDDAALAETVGGGGDAGPGDVSSDDVAASADAVADSADGGGGMPQSDTTAAPPTSLAKAPEDLIYGPLQAGPRPIDDAIAAMVGAVGANAAETSIRDLTQTAAGIMVSYGTSGEFMAPATVAKLPALALRAISGAKAIVSDATQTHDAFLPRFVVVADGTVWAPGGRPLGGGTKGSLYRYPVGGPWQRFESVPNALTLLDVATHDGAIFAIGSSGTAAEIGKGEHHATLWRSEDGAQFFDVVFKVWNAGEGLSQLRWFVRDGKQLIALGRRLDAQGKTIALPHVVWSPPTALPLSPTHPLKSIEPRAVAPTAQGEMLVGGQDLLAKGDPVLLRAGESGIVALDAAGGTLIDTWPLPSLSETLLLERTDAKAYRVRLLRADGSLELLWTGSAQSPLECLAWIDGALLFGAQDGGLWLAASAWKPGRAP